MDIAAHVRRAAYDRTIRLVATARLRDPVLLKLVAQADLAAIEEIEGGLPGLALAGAAYRGIGIPACVLDGRRAARSVRAALSCARS